jgi:uncharacterized repeat protein (TIGR03803 family)
MRAYFGARYIAVRLAAVVLSLSALAGQNAAHAYTLKTLYSFCAKTNCADGREPESRPLIDAQGNLYLTTDLGGANNFGAVVELTYKHNTWRQKVIHDFTTQDGGIPYAGLIMDVSGNLYGTTLTGGLGGGVVYELMPKKKRWILKILYEFCSAGSPPCLDGESPKARLTYQGDGSGALYDGVSPLYGTTVNGGSGGSLGGVAYELTLDAGTWTETVLHDFCKKDDENCTDGEELRGGLAVDDTGELYGTTYFGGKNGDGEVFQLKLKSGRSKWSERSVYDFCPTGSCLDGFLPTSEVTLDASGKIFGTTSDGGTPQAACKQHFGIDDCGTVFQLAGRAQGAKESLLYSFCSAENCADGALPQAGLVEDGAGNLIGTTTRGGTGAAFDFGSAGSGTVFLQNGTTHQVLYSFCALDQCVDGADPDADVAIDGAGNIFGTTSAGGANGVGTVFELSP